MTRFVRILRLILYLLVLPTGCSTPRSTAGTEVVPADAKQSLFYGANFGLVEYRPGAASLQTVFKRNISPIDHTVVGNDGTVWIAAANVFGRNLWSYESGTHERFAYHHEGRVQAIAVGSGESVALLEANGDTIVEFQRGVADAIRTEHVSGAKYLTYDSTGSLWIAATDQFLRLDAGRIALRVRHSDPIESFTLNPRGDPYIGDRKGITRFDREGLRRGFYAIPLSGNSTVRVDSSGRLYVFHQNACKSNKQYIQSFAAGSGQSAKRIGPFDGIGNVAFDRRDRVYVHVDACAPLSDITFPWDERSHLEIYGPGFDTKLTTIEEPDRLPFFVGPPSLTRPAPLSRVPLVLKHASLFEYRLLENGILEKRRRKNNHLIWSRNHISAFSVAESGVPLAYSDGSAQLLKRDGSRSSFRVGKVGAVRLSPGGRVYTIAWAPSSDSAIVTAFDEHGRHIGDRHFAYFGSLRFDENDRPLIADTSYVTTFSTDLHRRLKRVSVGTAVIAVAYNRKQRLLAIGTLDGDILQFEGPREFTTLSSGFVRSRAFSFDPAGNLWVVNETSCPVREFRISVFAPGQVHPSRILHVPADANARGIVADGDGSAAIFTQSCSPRLSGGLIRIDSTGKGMANDQQLRSIGFSNQ